MRKGIQRFLPLLMAGTLLLSGCATFPELSEQEQNRIANYAAGILLRYAKNSPDKLTYLDPSYTPAHLADAETIIPPAPEPTPQPEPTPEPQPQPEPETPEQQTPEEQPPAETPDPQDGGGEETPAPEEPQDTPAAEGEGTETPEEEPPAQEPMDLGEVVALESSLLQSVVGGLHVEYNGYSIRNAYPDTTAQGAVIAMPGDKLLTVDFRVRNNTDQAVTVNTANAGPQYKLIINGDVQGFTLVTMIENDLSSLLTTIAPGQVFDTVLLMELPESLAKSVDRLALQIIVNGERQTIELE